MALHLIALSALIALTACDSPSAPEEPRPLPQSTAPERFKELSGDRFRYWPSSAPAKAGESYRFKLYTHCGIDNSVIDFDGSLWDPADSDVKGSFDDPDDNGVIRLVTNDEAEFTSSKGTVVKLQRRDGPKVVPGCM